MTKFHAAFLSLLLPLLFGSAARCQQSNKPLELKPGAIASIKLDQNLITLPCPLGHENCDCLPSSDPLVAVKLEIFRPDRNVRYRFSVTGGKIIGEGTQVIWDLTKTAPGTYTIQASAIRIGKTLLNALTETVNVLGNIISCDCFGCPIVEINATKGVISPGESVTISASISGSSQDNPLSLNWTTFIGQIVSGQGTSAIVVKVPPDTKATKLIVSLTIGGLHGPCSSCPTSQSVTINLKPST